MGNGRVSAGISIDRAGQKGAEKQKRQNIANAFFATPNASTGRRGCAGRRPRMTPTKFRKIIST
jgi:hypothetical protein